MIKNISIDLLVPFENHPFKKRNGIEQQELTESIKENGLLEPIIVRSFPAGKYEIISGHRRVEACKALGITSIPVTIKDLSQIPYEHSIWLGWLDLNQQMPVSETGALTIWRHPSILAGIGRLEHPRAVLETAVLPVKLYPCMMMVMPAGFEPSITSLRGLRPNQLDEGTRWRYGSDSNRRITVLQAALLNLLSTVSWLG